MKKKLTLIRDYWRYYCFTTTHKWYVFIYMCRFCSKLMWRALKHDLTKYKPCEVAGFLHLLEVFKDTQYGSAEYNAILEREREAIHRHYKMNDHHPEHHNSLSDMNIYQLVEMMVDWHAAVKKNKNGSVERSFIINKKRFNMSDELARILKTM